MTADDVPELKKKVVRDGGDTLGYLETTIKYKFSLGLFDETGKLQAWLYGSDIGSHGTLGVTDGNKQKGAASALAVKFAQTLLKDIDMDFVWNTAHGNDAMNAMTAKFNSQKIGMTTWMSVKKRGTGKMIKLGMYQVFYPNV